ncbi:MAG: hypothetical protein GVY10_00925 [Verrucomicrobia bacterium]|nr:hypothetical protein [Verrucomicrobiota bacterium]
MEQKFTDEELRGIISTALKRQHIEASTFSREQLEETAREFGIEGDRLDTAISEYFATRRQREQAHKKEQQQRRGVLLHVFLFVVFNIGFVVANQFFGMDLPLHLIFPFWGLGLIFHILQDWFGIDLGEMETDQ